MNQKEWKNNRKDQKPPILVKEVSLVVRPHDYTPSKFLSLAVTTGEGQILFSSAMKSLDFERGIFLDVDGQAYKVDFNLMPDALDILQEKKEMADLQRALKMAHEEIGLLKTELRVVKKSKPGQTIVL